MTSATDNRTTKLLKDYVFTLRRLEYDADKPGSNMTLGEYEAEEKRVTDEYAQAIAATLGNACAERTCKSTTDDNAWCFVCSECGKSFPRSNLHLAHNHGEINYCPNCGRRCI